MEARQAVPAGTKLSLFIFLPGDPDPITVEHASVRWVKGRTCGVNIILMQPHDWFRLSQFVTRLMQQHFGSTGIVGKE